MKFWKTYYWRPFGAMLSGGGLALILEELAYGGGFDLDSPFQHELYGIVMFLVGIVLFLRYKDEEKD